MTNTTSQPTRKPVVLIGMISLLSAIVCGASGVFAAVTYTKNWFRPAAWIKLSHVFDYDLAKAGMISGLVIGLCVGYLWCKYMHSRTEKYRALDNPRYLLLLREGLAMGITFGWIGGVALLICLHSLASQPLETRALFTYVPIAVAVALLGGLLLGGVCSLLWWVFDIRKGKTSHA